MHSKNISNIQKLAEMMFREIDYCVFKHCSRFKLWISSNQKCSTNYLPAIKLSGGTTFENLNLWKCLVRFCNPLATHFHSGLENLARIGYNAKTFSAWYVHFCLGFSACFVVFICARLGTRDNQDDVAFGIASVAHLADWTQQTEHKTLNIEKSKGYSVPNTMNLGKPLKTTWLFFCQGFFFVLQCGVSPPLYENSATLTAEKIPKGVKSGPNWEWTRQG